MMTNYKTVNVGMVPADTSGKFATTAYEIVEMPTDQVITIKPSIEAKWITKHLNRGGGFAGWTPSFFLNNLRFSEK